MPPEPVAVTVYTREDCHLCVEALAELREIAAEEGIPVAIEEVDVDRDEELREAYGERVPYGLIEGRPAFKYRLDLEQVRRRLRAASETSD